MNPAKLGDPRSRGGHRDRRRWSLGRPRGRGRGGQELARTAP